ncbi:hypothetical protein L228DRAFT_282933 [Xylona heveae TC161]|uniref:BTB domain-containing protein n=1 Tax=Xylona heveae (strain CBS 132557 / TC161) TaxID=1328760 RepID=A0A165H125_XYLHT|nr:hypothetical protein L228DRAFT_282933 [Xylona heveae TC161]KZF22854.1 hypothetical protein L228DRAFT_282933 [Xylona heveae TC161]
MAPHPESSPRRPTKHEGAMQTSKRPPAPLKPVVPIVPVVPRSLSYKNAPVPVSQHVPQPTKPASPAVTKGSRGSSGHPGTERSKASKSELKEEQQAALPRSIDTAEKRAKATNASKSLPEETQKASSNGLSAQAQQEEQTTSEAETREKCLEERPHSDVRNVEDDQRKGQTVSGKGASASSQQNHSPVQMNGTLVTAPQSSEQRRLDDISAAGQSVNSLARNTEAVAGLQDEEATLQGVSTMPRPHPISFHPPNGQSTPSSAGSMYAQPPMQYNRPMPHQHRSSAGGVLFGGFTGSSSPSPAPPIPHSTASMPYPPPGTHPHGFVAPPFEQPFHYFPHQHHVAEPHPGFVYPPTFPPQHGPYGHGSEPFNGHIPAYGRFGSFDAAGTPSVSLPMMPPRPLLEDQVHRAYGIQWDDASLSTVAPDSDAGSGSGRMRDVITPRPSSSADEKAWLELELARATLSGRMGSADGVNNNLPHVNGNFSKGELNRDNHHHQPSPPVDTSDDIKYYLRGKFSDTDFADYLLEIHHPKNAYWYVPFAVHGVIVGRSHFLRYLLLEHRNKPVNPSGMKKVKLLIDDPFIQPGPFAMALRHLYGAPLLTAQDIEGIRAHPTFVDRWTKEKWILNNPEDKMEFALSYAAAGYLLDFENITACGVQVAAEFIGWDTVELALSFALEGLSIEDPEMGSNPHPAPPSPIGFTDAQTNVQQVRKLAISHGEAYNPSLGGKYGVFGVTLMNKILDFIIENIPADFELDTSISQLGRHPRLFVNSETKPNISHPRLAAIQFGELPSEDTSKLEFSTKVLSKILISLPYVLLKYILESPRLGGVQGWASYKFREKVARNVIREREMRRQNTLAAALNPANTDGASLRSLNYLAWKEVVLTNPEVQHHEVEVKREWDSLP